MPTKVSEQIGQISQAKSCKTKITQAHWLETDITNPSCVMPSPPLTWVGILCVLCLGCYP